MLREYYGEGWTELIDALLVGDEIIGNAQNKKHITHRRSQLHSSITLERQLCTAAFFFCKRPPSHWRAGCTRIKPCCLFGWLVVTMQKRCMYKKIFVFSDLADGGRAVLHRFHTQSVRHRHGQVEGPHAKWTCRGLDMFNNITK